ncbi:MAG TPA: aldo/keto reductase [Pseudonocardiaceae bacterium]|nr:aldo/keto reductase [Pseudonocardiaceae bacterium]
MNFGDVTDEATGFEIMDGTLDAGINVIDTADVYGGPQFRPVRGGHRAVAERGSGRRDRLVLATKVYQPMDTGPNDRRLSAYHIRKACQHSLRRL